MIFQYIAARRLSRTPKPAGPHASGLRLLSLVQERNEAGGYQPPPETHNARRGELSLSRFTERPTAFPHATSLTAASWNGFD
jgi:hypothetical protein